MFVPETRLQSRIPPPSAPTSLQQSVRQVNQHCQTALIVYQTIGWQVSGVPVEHDTGCAEFYKLVDTITTDPIWSGTPQARRAAGATDAMLSYSDALCMAKLLLESNRVLQTELDNNKSNSAQAKETAAVLQNCINDARAKATAGGYGDLNTDFPELLELFTDTEALLARHTAAQQLQLAQRKQIFEKLENEAEDAYNSIPWVEGGTTPAQCIIPASINPRYEQFVTKCHAMNMAMSMWTDTERKHIDADGSMAKRVETLLSAGRLLWSLFAIHTALETETRINYTTEEALIKQVNNDIRGSLQKEYAAFPPLETLVKGAKALLEKYSPDIQFASVPTPIVSPSKMTSSAHSTSLTPPAQTTLNPQAQDADDLNAATTLNDKLTTLLDTMRSDLQNGTQYARFLLGTVKNYINKTGTPKFQKYCTLLPEFQQTLGDAKDLLAQYPKEVQLSPPLTTSMLPSSLAHTTSTTTPLPAPTTLSPTTEAVYKKTAPAPASITGTPNTAAPVSLTPQAQTTRDQFYGHCQKITREWATLSNQELQTLLNQMKSLAKQLKSKLPAAEQTQLEHHLKVVTAAIDLRTRVPAAKALLWSHRKLDLLSFFKQTPALRQSLDTIKTELMLPSSKMPPDFAKGLTDLQRDTEQLLACADQTIAFKRIDFERWTNEAQNTNSASRIALLHHLMTTSDLIPLLKACNTPAQDYAAYEQALADVAKLVKQMQLPSRLRAPKCFLPNGDIKTNTLSENAQWELKQILRYWSTYDSAAQLKHSQEMCVLGRCLRQSIKANDETTYQEDLKLLGQAVVHAQEYLKHQLQSVQGSLHTLSEISTLIQEMHPVVDFLVTEQEDYNAVNDTQALAGLVQQYHSLVLRHAQDLFQCALDHYDQQKYIEFSNYVREIQQMRQGWNLSFISQDNEVIHTGQTTSLSEYVDAVQKICDQRIQEFETLAANLKTCFSVEPNDLTQAAQILTQMKDLKLPSLLNKHHDIKTQAAAEGYTSTLSRFNLYLQTAQGPNTVPTTQTLQPSAPTVTTTPPPSTSPQPRQPSTPTVTTTPPPTSPQPRQPSTPTVTTTTPTTPPPTSPQPRQQQSVPLSRPPATTSSRLVATSSTLAPRSPPPTAPVKSVQKTQATTPSAGALPVENLRQLFNLANRLHTERGPDGSRKPALVIQMSQYLDEIRTTLPIAATFEIGEALIVPGSGGTKSYSLMTPEGIQCLKVLFDKKHKATTPSVASTQVVAPPPGIENEGKNCWAIALLHLAAHSEGVRKAWECVGTHFTKEYQKDTKERKYGQRLNLALKAYTEAQTTGTILGARFPQAVREALQYLGHKYAGNTSLSPDRDVQEDACEGLQVLLTLYCDVISSSSQQPEDLNPMQFALKTTNFDIDAQGQRIFKIPDPRVAPCMQMMLPVTNHSLLEALGDFLYEDRVARSVPKKTGKGHDTFYVDIERKMVSFPQELNIMWNRFCQSTDHQGNPTCEKLSNEAEVPLSFEWPITGKNNTREAKYDLTFFFSHVGIHSATGHYITYCKEGDQWFKLDGKNRVDLTKAEVLEALKTSYFLQFKRSE